MDFSIHDSILLFVHVQKTAGQTLREILHRQYGDESCMEIGRSAHHTSLEELKQLPQSRRDTLKCVMAHLPYGLHCLFNRTYAYITMLRDPLERAVSQYFYICRTPTNERYTAIKETGFSFLSYVENNEFGRPDNMQTRYITGEPSKEKMDMEDLKHAQHMLLNEYAAFGITERFDDSIRLFTKQFNWKQRPFQSKNQTLNRPAVHSLNHKALQLLKEKNHYDLKLHEFAQNAFSKRMQRL